MARCRCGSLSHPSFTSHSKIHVTVVTRSRHASAWRRYHSATRLARPCGPGGAPTRATAAGAATYACLPLPSQSVESHGASDRGRVAAAAPLGSSAAPRMLIYPDRRPDLRIGPLTLRVAKTDTN